MRLISVNIFILLGVVVADGRVHGEESAKEIPSALVLERFAVAKNGDGLMVPVRVGKRDYLFEVDTGATITVFDVSIPLGEPVDVVSVDGAEGKVLVKLYHPPEARVGRSSLGPLDAVAGMDLSSLREVLGRPIRGILGMDFLGRYVVHIDIERGELLLLKSAPNDAGVELPISWAPGDHPFVVGEAGAGERVSFVIDTGATGLDSGSLGVGEIQSLVRKGQFREIADVMHETISGTNSRKLFQGRLLSLGDFAVPSPIFSESFGWPPNKLGMRFWSRFVATFDFPGHKVYVRKSARFTSPDRWNATGLHLWKRRDSIEVCYVDPDSPAARAGLKKGDLLVELNELIADKSCLFDLRDALCNGDQWTCVVRRDSQVRPLNIRLTRPGPGKKW
jgi:hypothetical protein